jgi:hypothetical protein
MAEGDPASFACLVDAVFINAIVIAPAPAPASARAY